MAEPRLAEIPEEIERCFLVMHQLRPALVKEEFVARIQVQRAHGFQLALLEAEGTVVAVAGFRIQEMLASGRTMYVDDLVTDAAARSRGHGKTMLRWLEAHARNAGCHTFSLDSGTFRQEAHAFYFREGLRVTSFHFAKPLG